MTTFVKLFLLTGASGLILSSCKDTWPEEYKQQYYSTCMEGAESWARSEAEAKTYCDCVLEKTVAKYPNVEDLLEHMHEVQFDTSIQACKQLIRP